VSVRNAKFALVAAGVALAAIGLLAQDVGYLDLSDPAPRDRIRSPNGGTGGFCGSSESSGNPEVILTLVSLDKRAYSMGEEVTFEVKVENTGKETIEVPWTQSLGDLEPSDQTKSYNYRTAAFVLTLTDWALHRSFSIQGYAYGSKDVPGTIRELRSSQSVLIRARRRLESHEDWLGKRVKEVQPLPLKASPRLTLNSVTYSPSEGGVSASENSSCIPLNAKNANEVDVALWPRGSE
jgi:hypothetical protein